jgi:hypothetical protein
MVKDTCGSDSFSGEGFMGAPTYDIYSGQFDTEATWLESVEGLGKAAMRMGQLTAKEPGAYFVFCKTTQRALLSVDTTAEGKQ